MHTYTLCDLDNNQTRSYPDCRYQSPPFDHTNHDVISAWSPTDDTSLTSGYDSSAVVDDEFCDTEQITSGHYPLDVTYYFRCPNYERCYEPVSAVNVGSWTHEGWTSDCRTYYTDNEYLTGSWGSIRDDVILDAGYGAEYVSLYDGTGLEYMEMLSAGRRQADWNDSEMVVSQDDQRTGNRYAASAGNENKLKRGIETFKWMTLRRGSSKYVQTGLYFTLFYAIPFLLTSYRFIRVKI